MIEIVNLSNENKYKAEEFLMKEPYKNAYMIYDLNNDNSEIKIVYENDIIKGILVIYNGNNKIIWFYGNRDSFKAVINNINYDKFIMIIDENNLDIIKSKYKIKYYNEYIMRLKIKDFIFNNDNNSRKLNNDDIIKYKEFINTANIKIDQEFYIKNFDVFGYFYENKIVSSGIIAAKSFKAYVFGNIYTLINYRNRGYAKSLISSMVKYCSNKTENIIIYVRSDNNAVNLYKNLGFKITGNRIFIDYNTNVIP